MRLRALLIIITLLGLIACDSRPSDGDIQRQVAAQLLSEGSNLYTIENFKKTNGFEPSQNVYIAEVSYDLVFQKSLSDLALNLHDRHDPLLAGLDLVALGLKYGQFETGERRHRTEQATFHKTEQGWLLQNNH